MDQTVRILIVEDNVIIADDMQSMLEEIGYEIVSSVMAYEQAVKVLVENASYNSKYKRDSFWV